MRKQDFCLCESKGAVQLRSNCTGRFTSDLVGNPKDRFSHVTAHLVLTPWIHVSFCFPSTIFAILIQSACHDEMNSIKKILSNCSIYTQNSAFVVVIISIFLEDYKNLIWGSVLDGSFQPKG